MVKLPTRLRFTTTIQSIDLACEIGNNVDVIAIGNGRMHTTDKIKAPILQYTELKTTSCQDDFPKQASFPGVMCAIGEEKRSVCLGDSGGPLINYMNKLVGLTSFGYKSECELGVSSGFTRIPAYIEWIQQKTGIGCK